MNCAACESNISDYVENSLDARRTDSIDRHLNACSGCRELLTSVQEVMDWSATFPSHAPPSWLSTRIVSSTPALVRERWRDTFANAWQWASTPRLAMTVFASVLLVGWTANLAGVSTNPATLIRDPSAAYYGAEGLVYEAYDEAVRFWYRSRIVTELNCRIEQLREIA